MHMRYMLFPMALVFTLVGVYFWGQGVQLFFDGEAAATTDDPPSPSAVDGTPRQSMTGFRLGRGGKFIKRRKPFTPEKVPVVVAVVEQSEVPVFLSGLGTVIAYNTVDIKAQVDGIITKLNFQDGDDVKAGDPLVTIDPTPYQAQVERWQAAKQRAEAQLANANTNLSRAQQLLAKNYATQKQTDEQAALVSQYTADVAEAEAQIKFAQTQLDLAIVRSPINGRTGIRHVDAGNFIRAANNVNIVTVVQLQPISVIVSVSAKDLAQAGASPGTSDLPVLAYAQNGTTLLDRGQLQTVNNVVNPTSGTIQLKANFPNEQYRLWPGDFVKCKIVVEQRQNGITVPSAAIRHGPKGDFVWVIRPDNTAEAKTVKVKQTIGDRTLLDYGLEAGEQVVIEGQYHLQADTRVEIVSKEPTSGQELTDQ
jgi:multidrug efflux system membrane fusion protein